MRTTLLGLAALVLASTSASAAAPKLAVAPNIGSFANQPNVRDHRTLPDLDVVSLYTAGDVVQLGIVNRGGPGNNRASSVRLMMYRTVNGRSTLVATAYAAIPMIPKGTSARVSVNFPSTTANSRIVGELDYANQVPESNENNNRFQRTVK